MPRLYGGGGADFDGAVAEQAVVEAAWVDLRALIYLHYAKGRPFFQ